MMGSWEENVLSGFYGTPMIVWDDNLLREYEDPFYDDEEEDDEEEEP